MPQKVLEYRCLLISPGDVTEERDALVQVVTDWNAQIGRSLGARVELVKWESHSIPEMGGEVQSILNEQIVDDCDLGVAVFWSRLGTPTGKHPSGSVEEIYRLRDNGAEVMVYFSKAPIPQDVLNGDQFTRLQEVKEKLEKGGLLHSYDDVASLKSKFTFHLTSKITRLLERDKTDESRSKPVSNEVVTAPKPDVKVSAYVGVILIPGVKRHKRLLAFSVRNLSPQPVFISRLYFKTHEGPDLMPTHDAATGESLLYDRRLESGNSITLSVDPQKIQEEVPLDQLTQAVITDAVGREYPVPDEVFSKAIKDFQKVRE